MAKKKDSLWSILFRLFFAALFFGGDFIQEFDVSADNLPILYFGLLWLVIAFAFAANKIKKILADFVSINTSTNSAMSTVPSTVPLTMHDTGNQSNISWTKIDVSDPNNKVNFRETITGEVVNPLSVDGR